MANLDELRFIWRNTDAVTFDVDSTVIQEEGIDELAKFCGKEEEVVALTNKAMQGTVSFRQSLTERLEIIKPTLMQIEQFLASRPLNLSIGIEALVRLLLARGKQVFLISGGFYRLIVPIADSLGICSENIFANRLKFDSRGEYVGFDQHQPTAENGGKAKVIEHIKEKKGFKIVAHVGDGVTDLETKSIADLFIGYGGNVIRDSVKLQSPWFVTNFNELVDAL